MTKLKMLKPNKNINPIYSQPDIYNYEYNHDKQKWSKSVALAVGIHALPLLIAAYWIGPITNPPPEEPAIFIDMSPAAAPPSPPTSQQPPAPEQVQPKQVQTEKAKPEPNKMVANKPDTVTPKQVPNITNPAVSLPMDTLPIKQPVKYQETTPQQETKPDKPAEPPQQSEPVKTSSNPAPNPSPPTLSQPRQDSIQGRITWQGLILDRLNRFLQYPPNAMSQKQQGVPYVRITMDRNGKVLSTSLERSSGFPMLDKEAVALPKRASPLPKPPQDINGTNIQIVVPVEFYIK